MILIAMEGGVTVD